MEAHRGDRAGVLESRRAAWKPSGNNVRNIRTVRATEPDIVFDVSKGQAGDIPRSESSAVMARHTYFEYEKLEWRRHRSFSANGDGPADVRWPEYALGPGQRISEQREVYRAKFSAGADGGRDEYVTELDEATWRTLKVGIRCRLTVGAFSEEVKQVTPGHNRERRSNLISGQLNSQGPTISHSHTEPLAIL